MLSPALAAATKTKVPDVERRGISYERILSNGKTGPALAHFERADDGHAPSAVDFQYKRFPSVTRTSTHPTTARCFFEVP